MYSRILIIMSVFIALTFIATDLSATHNRAGEITYEQLDDLTIRATIVTYTKTSSFGADRDSLTLYWGDGDSTFVRRTSAEELPNDIKKNEYVSDHTYPTRGTYKLSVTDPNRIAGILNIDFPNSVNIQFYIETTLTLLEPRFQGRNNSVILLQPPIDFACSDQVFTYNPNAFDIDGDSITYELVAPFAAVDVEVPNYELPDQIGSAPDNMIFLDTQTGDFRWDAPKILGEYNITYRINEYRNGTLINSLIRDMQILVRPCPDNNEAPTFNEIEDICVLAGELVTINLEALDVNPEELLNITATGGPFELSDSPASLQLDQAIQNSMLSGQILWQTTCNHVSEEYYQIVIRTSDELSKPMTGLATLKTIRIKVVAPPPENIEATNVNGVVTVTWESPYQCETGNDFTGFSVWRRIGSSTVDIDTCQGGLEGQGFERVVFLTDEMENGRYIARDAEIEPGNIYCYRILGEFAQTTPFGNFFNITQSLPSEEVCIRSSGEEPLITNVSIESTSRQSGEVKVIWINPNSDAIDTTLLPGPYTISVNGAPNIVGSNLTLQQEYMYNSGSFGSIADTSVVLDGLNTIDNGHSYDVTFMSGLGPDDFKATSDIASSVFLSASPSDERIILSWEENVPWNNFNYNIYEVQNGNLNLLDSSMSQDIVIEELENGVEYCFLIESQGSYGITDVPSPLINYSNEACATPQDNEPPCPPSIIVSSICDEEEIVSGDVFENRVSWQFASTTCEEAEDIAGYNIYFASNVNDNAVIIDRVDANQSLYIHQLEENISGCYSVTVVDLSGNESELSNEICIDNCPSYVLPNAFTPNNDNSNDLFVPRLNRFINRVEFELFNRWGQKVYETSDPDLNWNGTNLSGKELAEGTYFYSCVVFENRVDGVTEGELLRGTIQLIR